MDPVVRSRTLRADDGGLSSDQNLFPGQEGRSKEEEGKGGAFLKSNLKIALPVPTDGGRYEQARGAVSEAGPFTGQCWGDLWMVIRSKPGGDGTDRPTD